MKNISTKMIALMAACVISGCETPGNLAPNDLQKVTDAVRTDNLSALKQMFDHLPPGNDQRSTTDKDLLNQALQMTASKGETCNMEMANYLYGKGALTDYYNMPDKDFAGLDPEFKRYKIPLCGNFLIDSHKKYMADRVSIMQSQDKRNKEVKGFFIKLSYNNLVAFLNNVNYQNPKELAHGIRSFTELSRFAVKYGKEACSEDIASESCVSYGLYKKLQEELLATKNFAKKSEAYRQLKDFDSTLKQMML